MPRLQDDGRSSPGPTFETSPLCFILLFSLERLQSCRNDIAAWDNEALLNDMFVGVDILLFQRSDEFMILAQGEVRNLRVSGYFVLVSTINDVLCELPWG
jgi:hypothetical protein